MNRRRFLKAGVGISASRIWPRENGETIPVGSSSSLFGGRTSVSTPIVFPQSVASGDPSPNGIVLWTRLAPESIPGGGNSAFVVWQISSTPSFESGEIVLQGVQSVSDEDDFTAKVALYNVGLQPWTVYYYRFGFEGIFSNTGRFKTLPLPGMNLQSLRLGYISCQDYSNGYFTALTALADEPLDYVVHLGDYIYEAIALTGVVRVVPAFPSGGSVAATLDDYRHLYRVYRSDTSLQRVHENFAFFQIWDDHEFANDGYQIYHPDNNPNPSQPTPELRQAASQAWSEYSATNIPFDPRLDPLHSIQIYRSFQFGTLVELVMTDARLYRSGPPCGLNIVQRFLTVGCPERTNPSRTMLASTQKTWFIDRMQSSPAIWKIWGNEMMNMSLKVVRGIDVFWSLDSWDGYPAERHTIFQSFANVRNLVAITGDNHSFFAGFLSSSYGLFPEQPPVGVEFVGGSVSSVNLSELLSSRESQTFASAPVPPRLLKQSFPGGLASLALSILNPQLVFFNSETHGYSVLEITPAMLICTMKGVSTVRQPQATVSKLASFTVPAGQHRIIRNE